VLCCLSRCNYSIQPCKIAEVAKVLPADLRPKRTLPKTHKDFWKERLERRCYTEDGLLHEVNEFSVRIRHLGRRQWSAPVEIWTD
jgi:hypothetical protein